MFSTKLNHSLLVFVLAILLLFSCSEPTEPDSSIFELVPLDVGNEWEYAITRYDTTGNILYEHNGTSKIFKDTVFNGIRWYCDIPYYICNWYTNKSDGYWIFYQTMNGQTLRDTAILLYKYPTYVGEIYGNPEYPSEVVSVDEEISVPAGNFKVIHITHDLTADNYSPMISYETYICPGIGFIKSMQIGKREDGTKYVIEKSELVRFQLKRYFGNLY